MSADAPSALALFCTASHLVRTVLKMTFVQHLVMLSFRQITDNTMDAASPQCCKAIWQTCTSAQISIADVGVVHDTRREKHLGKILQELK